ncbi:MAG: LLM class F420-dependent oxidoreductase [Chloroflexi bacterium]|nr:MAG: LLM class F420-dependent oxidoreductase [Chloroflexota bacterium]
MKFGLVMFPTDYAIDPVTLGRAAEEHGFESLWFPEHTHIPTSRQTPWPGGAELPEEYRHTLDPFVALGAVAAVTSRLGLGFGVCLVIERDPIVLAKEVASLDFLSGGRVLLGVGGGWNVEEMRNHGTDYATRWTLLRERVEAMKAIWTSDAAEYHGRLVDFDPVWSWPKPVQKPHPPVIVGGDGPRTLHRVVRYGDGWMPIVGRAKAIAEYAPRIEELRRLAESAGRDPVGLPVSFYYARSPNAEAIEDAIKLGIDRLIISLPPRPAAEVLPRMDALAELVRPYT